MTDAQAFANELLACPSCGASAWSSPEDSGQAERDDLTCGRCGLSLPVQGGVLILTPTSAALQSRDIYNEVWDAASEHYKEEDSYAAEADVLALFEDRMRHRTILDAGCGDGRLIAHWSKMAPKGMVFMDVSDGIFAAKARYAASSCAAPALFIQGSLDSIPLRGRSVDLVWSSGVLPLISDQTAVIGEMTRVATESVITGVTSNGALGRVYQGLNVVRPLCRFLHRAKILGPIIWCIAALLLSYSRAMAALGLAAFPFSKEGTQRIARDPGGLKKLRALLIEPFIAPNVTRHPDAWYHSAFDQQGFTGTVAHSEFLIDYLDYVPSTAARR